MTRARFFDWFNVQIWDEYEVYITDDVASMHSSFSGHIVTRCGIGQVTSPQQVVKRTEVLVDIAERCTFRDSATLYHSGHSFSYLEGP